MLEYMGVRNQYFSKLLKECFSNGICVQRFERGEENLQGEGRDSTEAVSACQRGWSCQMGVSNGGN